MVFNHPEKGKITITGVTSRKGDDGKKRNLVIFTDEQGAEHTVTRYEVANKCTVVTNEPQVDTPPAPPASDDTPPVTPAPPVDNPPTPPATPAPPKKKQGFWDWLMGDAF